MKRLSDSAVSLTQPEPSNLKALRGELGRRWPMTGLGFVKDALRRLVAVSYHDLRVGMRFPEEAGEALHQALRDAADTATRVNFERALFADCGPVSGPCQHPGRGAARTISPDTIQTSFRQNALP